MRIRLCYPVAALLYCLSRKGRCTRHRVGLIASFSCMKGDFAYALHVVHKCPDQVPFGHLSNDR